MLAFARISLSSEKRQKLYSALRVAEATGNLRMWKRCRAIIMIAAGATRREIGACIGVSAKSIGKWFSKYLLQGVRGLKPGKSPGRPGKLTKSQREQLRQDLMAGPESCGYGRQCWATPMIQDYIYNKFGVFYSVKYLSEFLKSMGFSYQKARFVSDHIDPEARNKWREERWPRIVKIARERNAVILFGDEASFPQWGSLFYTWSPRGLQPVVKTSGKRKGYKVFGVIDYFSGQFYWKCIETRFNSETYAQFLREVMRKIGRRIILIHDNATYHTSALMKKFYRDYSHQITVEPLPAYSPDYNPIEKLWKKIKTEGTHLHYFPTFEHLATKVRCTLTDFEGRPEEVLRLFGMYRKGESLTAREGKR